MLALRETDGSRLSHAENDFLFTAFRSRTPAFQLLPEAGAERRLEVVSCKALILIEAPSPADHRGMLIRGKTC